MISITISFEMLSLVMHWTLILFPFTFLTILGCIKSSLVVSQPSVPLEWLFSVIPRWRSTNRSLESFNSTKLPAINSFRMSVWAREVEGSSNILYVNFAAGFPTSDVQDTLNLWPCSCLILSGPLMNTFWGGTKIGNSHC